MAHTSATSPAVCPNIAAGPAACASATIGGYPLLLLLLLHLLAVQDAAALCNRSSCPSVVTCKHINPRVSMCTDAFQATVGKVPLAMCPLLRPPMEHRLNQQPGLYGHTKYGHSCW